jgi:hypothetical protein
MSQGRKKSVGVCNAESLKQCLGKILTDGTFAQVEFAASCTWSAVTLVAAALFWVWSDDETLTDRFQTARRITITTFGLRQNLSAAYQPFMRMLSRWSELLMARVQDRLRQQMRSSPFFLEAGFALFAVDGSRFEVARTQSNERAFSPRDDNGKRKRRKSRQNDADRKKSNSPQVWVTTLWHMGCGLPWSWRHGESGSSERVHFREMLNELPAEALIAADAGFAGYEYWKAILEGGREFVIRVGANVKLLKQLGYARESAGRVYLWTDRAASQQQPPLVLRLVVIQGRKQPVYLVTSVLGTHRLTDSQLAKIYARRWGVELFYRHVKQTFDKRKLRSHKAEHVRLELGWSLIGLWAVCWLAQLEQRTLPPQGQSVAKVLRGIRRIMRERHCDPEPGRDLRTLWREARIDTYRRKNKSSRNYPRKKTNREFIGTPIISKATREQRVLAAKYRAIQG